jgi:hypothetical protein
MCRSRITLLAIVLILTATAQTLHAGPPNPRWKILVLIYENVEVQYTDIAGVFHEITTTMTSEEIEVASNAAKRFFETDVVELSSEAMRPLLTIKVKHDTLRNLSPIGACPFQGFWPDPLTVQADREQDRYDSAVVIWKGWGWDSATQSAAGLACYGGLTWPTGISQTYTSFILEAVSPIERNIFKHEWGHSILYYYDDSGAAPKPPVNNHINSTDNRYVRCGAGADYFLVDENDYNLIPNSIYNNWSGFTHDYYSGRTATPDQPTRCLGITPATWATGGPVTRPISNPGDLNGDLVVDRRDLNMMLPRVGTPAQTPSDPFDLDYDGTVTVLDMRIAATLCSKPSCGI